MNEPKKILIFQTAFLGDVILTLPLLQVLKRNFPNSEIDFVTTPRASEIIKTHPAVNRVILFDKKNEQKGWKGVFKLANKLRKENYEIVFSPHRSFRTSILLFISNIPKRISFDKSSFSFLYTDLVFYDNSKHEVERNLSLLEKIGITISNKEIPKIGILKTHKEKIDKIILENSIGKKIICIAPGSIWNTKRWTPENFAKTIELISQNFNNYTFILIGANEDETLCEQIISQSNNSSAINLAGKLSLIESAELISRAEFLISNDSAPLHIGVAVETKVVAIFGPTVTNFGFAPYGNNHLVIENKNLKCRPCSKHGGDSCPIKTFECMLSLTPEKIFSEIKFFLKN